MKRFLLLLFTALLTAGAEEATSVLAETDKTTAALAGELKVKLGKIDTAIAAAVKEGALKPSTEAYFRDCLAHFQSSFPNLPETDRIYFPPRFDSNAAIEPINLAWADLRAELTRQQREQEKLSTRLLTAAIEGLAAAAQTAGRAADFAPLQKVIARMESVADPSRSRRPGSTEYDEREQVNGIRTLAQTMGEALEAQANKDQAGFAEAMSKLSEPAYSSRYTRIPALASAETRFRTRMLAPYRAETIQWQTKLEEGLMARHPAEELDALLGGYSASIKQLSAVLPSIERNGDPSTELLRAYRNGSQTLAALASHDLAEQAETGYKPPLELPLIHPALYRAFLRQLQRELKQPAGPGTEAGADLKLRTEIRQKLEALQTPEAATALADALPGLLPERARDSDQETQNLRGALSTLAQELRQLSLAWLENGPGLAIGGAAFEGRGEGLFALEMYRLRQRAWRESLVVHHGLSELKEPPYAALPVDEAVTRLSEALADRGDWKRSLAVAELLHLPNGYREESPASGRAQSIRMYLAGVNFEQAEQYSRAVEAYQQVLMTIADHIPLAETTDRLKKLRAAHPEAFAPVASGAPESLRNFRRE